MLKTLYLNSKIIGMYLSDHGSVYSNDKTTFIDSELSDYIPILNFIEINHKKEVTFANGINKNQEVVTYNKSTSNRSFREDVIRRDFLDVTENDLFVGPITIFLNFTNYNITVIDKNEFRKTFVPIRNKHLEKFEGKFIIFYLRTLNTPKLIQNISGCTNYLESLTDKFKNCNASNIEEMKRVIKYAADRWSETNIFNAASMSNSLKIATIVEVSETEFINNKNNTLYLINQELVVTLDNIIEADSHPHTTNSLLTNPGISKEVRKNSFTCYIVDNNDKISDRYVNIAGTVKKINKIKDPNLIDGLYIITVDSDGKTHNEILCKLEDIDNNKYVYKSIEEANIGADLKTQYKDNVEIAKTELEVNKVTEANKGLETKAKYELIIKEQEAKLKEYLTELERVRNEFKLNLEAFKAKEEKELTEKKYMLDKLKMEDEIRAIRERRDYESYLRELDRRNYFIKQNYEEIKYQRDSFVEGLKTIGAVAGVLATGFLIYNKIAKS